MYDAPGELFVRAVKCSASPSCMKLNHQSLQERMHPLRRAQGHSCYSLSGSVVRCLQLLRPCVFAYLFGYYIVIVAVSIASKAQSNAIV